MNKENKEMLKSTALIIFILGLAFSIPYLADVMEQLPTSVLFIIAVLVILTY